MTKSKLTYSGLLVPNAGGLLPAASSASLLLSAAPLLLFSVKVFFELGNLCLEFARREFVIKLQGSIGSIA